MNRKMTKKRLCVYLLVTFGVTWIPTILFSVNGGEYNSGAMEFILTFSMLCPAAAMLVTRFITKEGYSVNGRGFLQLGIDFNKRKWKWYLFAILIPIIYLDLGQGLMYLLFPKCFNPEMLEVYGVSEGTLWMYPIVGITSTVMLSIGALGEELGWRGYMIPKLEELFGIKKAIIVGGIIWGIWHFPANYMGHNFGTGYWGEPWSGFVVFTIFTVFVGALLVLVTVKTGSIWPATFLHAVNNSGSNMLAAYYDREQLTGIWREPVVSAMIQFVPVIILGIYSIIILCRDKEKTLVEQNELC